MLAAALLLTHLAPSEYHQIWDRALKDGLDGGGVVVRDGAVVWRSPLQGPERVIPACSVTKLMTSQIVLQLVAEEKLSLDTKVGEVIPWSPRVLKKVTIFQLLTHTSGLRNFDKAMGEDEVGFPSIYRTLRHPWSNLQSRLLLASGEETAYEPGTQYDYNNLDFLWLEAVIETIEGRSFGESLSARILRPAGMTRTRLAPWGPLPRDGVRSYEVQNGKRIPEEQFNFGVYGAAGAVLTTPGDVGSWLKWTLRDTSRSSPLVAGSQFGGFQGFGAYALSKEIAGREEKVVERPGAIANYRWQVSFLPEKGVAVATYSLNASSLGSVFEGEGITFDLIAAAQR